MLQPNSIAMLVYGFSIITPIMMVHHINAYKYCGGSATDLCKDTKHLMCDTSVLKPHATYLAHVPLTNKIRRLFIDEHNKIRDVIAGGGSGFAKATAMRDVIWDSELAYLAEVHSGLCSNTKDTCHNTARFEESGQNIHHESGAERLMVVDVINKTFFLWESGKDKAAKGDAFATKYTKTEGADEFTLIVNDQVSRVGCAVAYGEYCEKVRHCYYVTCNYDMGNIKDIRVYMHGTEAASKCGEWETDKNSKYKNLCHNKGKIFKPTTEPAKA